MLRCVLWLLELAIFYITRFLWPDSLYFVFVFFQEEEEFFYLLKNIGYSMVLFLSLSRVFVSVVVFELSGSVGKFVYFAFSLLPNSFQVHTCNNFYYLSQCTFLLSMWFTYFTLLSHIKLAYSVLI